MDRAMNLAASAATDSRAEECRIPCKLTWLEITKSPINYPAGLLALLAPGNHKVMFSFLLGEHPEGLILVYMHFPSAFENLHKEFFIFDEVTIISAIGGGLGLFLGFSCLSTLSFCIKATVERLT